MRTSWRGFEDVFYLCLQKMFSRCLQDVLVKMIIFFRAIQLQKTSPRSLDQDEFICLSNASLRHLPDVLLRRLQDFLKISSDGLQKSFQDVFKMSFKEVFKMYSRRFQEVFKTSSIRLQDIHKLKQFLLTRIEDVFKTFSRRTLKESSIQRFA